MKVTVEDCLKIDAFQGAQVAAGKSELNNEVRSISVLDAADPEEMKAEKLALLFKAVVSMFKKCPKNIVAYIIMAASFAAVAFFSANVIIVIVSAAVIGLAAALIAGKAGKKL